MRIGPLASILVCSVLVSNFAPPSFAVALRPNKATDASVCDLGHDTNAFLGSAMLVPAVASSTDQIEAYFRMAAGFVASRCSNGQVLILNGTAGSRIDEPSS